MENKETISKNPFILKTPDEAKNYFKTNNDLQNIFIDACFNSIPIDLKKNKAPFVANYGYPNAFACRRWLKTNDNIKKLLKKYKISLSNIFTGYKFMDYHDTRLESFPSSQDYENFINFSINLLTFTNYKDALQYALFGNTNKKLNNDDQIKFDKYEEYYLNNKETIESFGKCYNPLPGEIFTKCTNQSVKNDIQQQWILTGKYETYPNYTPKTDSISNFNEQISFIYEKQNTKR